MSELAIELVWSGLEVDADVNAGAADDDTASAAERAEARLIGERADAVRELVEKWGLVKVLETLQRAADSAADAHGFDPGRKNAPGAWTQQYRDATDELRDFSVAIASAVKSVSR